VNGALALPLFLGHGREMQDEGRDREATCDHDRSSHVDGGIG
jgi:hypothetical protein